MNGTTNHKVDYTVARSNLGFPANFRKKSAKYKKFCIVIHISIWSGLERNFFYETKFKLQLFCRIFGHLATVAQLEIFGLESDFYHVSIWVDCNKLAIKRCNKYNFSKECLNTILTFLVKISVEILEITIILQNCNNRY